MCTIWEYSEKLNDYCWIDYKYKIIIYGRFFASFFNDQAPT